MNREEVLKSEYSKLIANPDKIYLQDPYIIKAAHTAMDKWAEIRSIEFAKWVVYNDWTYLAQTDK